MTNEYFPNAIYEFGRQRTELALVGSFVDSRTGETRPIMDYVTSFRRVQVTVVRETSKFIITADGQKWAKHTLLSAKFLGFADDLLEIDWTGYSFNAGAELNVQ